MNPIALFFHCQVFFGNPPQMRPFALDIVREQMEQVKQSGLGEAAALFSISVNGGQESVDALRPVVPSQSVIDSNGFDPNREIPTIGRLQKWLPGNERWNILYFHSKGVSHPPDDIVRPELCMSPEAYFHFVTKWRRCGMKHLVEHWKTCISDLESGYESVGVHWMVNVGVPPIDTIWGGNFWWSTGAFLSTLKDIATLDSVHRPDLANEKCYNAEHWISSGPRLPKVKDYHPEGIGNCP